MTVAACDTETCQPTLREYLRSKQAQRDLEMAVSLLRAKIDMSETAQKAGRPLYSMVCSRIKSEDSILGKIHRKQYQGTPNPMERMNDLLGVRLICNFLDDVYRVAEVIGALPEVEMIRTKDYICHPKESGYRGLHLIFWLSLPGGRQIKLETQLRTAAMNFWSELDHELCYKQGNTVSRQRVSARLRRQAQVIAAMDQEMILLRNEINSL